MNNTEIGLEASAKESLTDLLWAAIKAADPADVIATNLPKKPMRRTIVIGAGKASAQMAQAFERAWGEEVSVFVVARYRYSVETDFVAVVEASHPVPGQAGLDAAEWMMRLVSDLTKDDLGSVDKVLLDLIL